MKKKYFSLIVLLVFGLKICAQQQKLVSSNPNNLVVKNTSSKYFSIKKIVDGISYEDFSSVSKILMLEKDAPALPTFSESLQLPNKGQIAVEITYDSFEEFDNIEIQPSKGSLKRNLNPNDVLSVFGNQYTQNEFFPGKLAQVGSPFIFRNTRGVTITFYPYQYNAVTKKMRVYKNITVEVTTNQNKIGQNEKNNTVNEINSTFSQLYKNLYLNNTTTTYNPIQDEGEMLVIAPSNYVSFLQPFINWKIEKGIKTTLVNLSETGTSPQSIKTYIQNFYQNNPNLVYVQLVGDHEDLASYTYGITGAQENLWSDSFYGQLEGDDFFPELMVGRFSGSIIDIQTNVARTLEYETNPITGNWMTKAIGIASNEGDGIGDDGEPDWQHLRNIGTKLIDYGYTTVHEFYDGTHLGNDLPDSPSSEMISNAINQGVGLFNYTGHGWTEGVSTGDYTSDDINLLTNSGKYPFVISVACNNGTFANSTSLCEVFTRVKHGGTPAGAIASCGSSILMAWAEPMQTQDEMTELIIRSDLQNIKLSLGGLFYNGQISMLEAYNQSPTSEEVMQTWVFFGDPSTVFRSKVSTAISANHEETITTSGADLLIYSNTNDALVVVTQNNEIIATSQILNGSTTVAIPALSSTNTLKVTLSKENTKPYRGEVNVTSLGLQSFKNQFVVYPNPASDVLHIRNSGNAIQNAKIQLFDINGRIIYLENNVDLVANYTVPTATIATGFYLLEITEGNNKKVQKIEIR